MARENILDSKRENEILSKGCSIYEFLEIF